mmetsp:Transcript_11609/g.43000  ORF Transcript_11609/g.43000 Transcript_11609/m.43000 type:complete len:354 (-) Transcript_11609:480-1541(-)
MITASKCCDLNRHHWAWPGDTTKGFFWESTHLGKLMGSARVLGSYPGSVGLRPSRSLRLPRDSHGNIRFSRSAYRAGPARPLVKPSPHGTSPEAWMLRTPPAPPRSMRSVKSFVAPNARALPATGRSEAGAAESFGGAAGDADAMRARAAAAAETDGFFSSFGTDFFVAVFPPPRLRLGGSSWNSLSLSLSASSSSSDASDASDSTSNSDSLSDPDPSPPDSSASSPAKSLSESLNTTFRFLDAFCDPRTGFLEATPASAALAAWPFKVTLTLAFFCGATLSSSESESSSSSSSSPFSETSSSSFSNRSLATNSASRSQHVLRLERLIHSSSPSSYRRWCFPLVVSTAATRAG